MGFFSVQRAYAEQTLTNTHPRNVHTLLYRLAMSSCVKKFSSINPYRSLVHLIRGYQNSMVSVVNSSEATENKFHAAEGVQAEGQMS